MSKKTLFVTIFVFIVVIAGCGGNDSCTTSKSYGVNSLTRKENPEICYEKIAKSRCFKNKNYSSEQIKDIIQGWQDKNFVFNKNKCQDLNTSKSVDCPDFIPESFKFSKLVGCEIYDVEPNTKCDAPCYDLYFSTNDEYFSKVSLEEGFGEKYIKSISSDGIVTFYSVIDRSGSISTEFSWSEKVEDGSEIKKGVIIYMEIVDPNAVEDEPAPDEDSDNITDEDEEIEITNE